MVIAWVYRAPDVTLFCDNIDRLFNQVVIKKTILICGDFNIDLLKHVSHSSTKYFLDLTFSLDMYRVITKLTRISNVSTTLIDNIFINDTNSDITNGLLITDISDHLSVFGICKYDGNRCNRSCPARYNCQTSSENINALKTALNAHPWDSA